MENVGHFSDEHPTIAALTQSKNQAGPGKPQTSPDDMTSNASTECDPDCSHGIIETATSSPFAVQKDGESGRQLAVNHSNELREKKAKGKGLCLLQHTSVENRNVAASGDEKNDWVKERMAREFRVDGSVSAMEESEQNEARRCSRDAAADQGTGLHTDERSDTLMANQPHSGIAPGRTIPFENDVPHKTPSGSHNLDTGNDDASKSPVRCNAVRPVPTLRNVVPTEGGKATSVEAPAGISCSRRGDAVEEMVFLVDKLLAVDPRREARVEERLHTEHKNAEEAKNNLGVVCPEISRCGLQTVELRRQRDQAYGQVEQLEKEIISLPEKYNREIHVLIQKSEKLKEENRSLLAVGAEQGLYLQELSRWDHSSMSEAVCDELALQLEAYRLIKEILLKEDELQALDANFHRLDLATEKRDQAASAHFIKLDTMLHRVLSALEAEVSVVSECPTLMQLLLSLRCYAKDSNTMETSSS